MTRRDIVGDERGSMLPLTIFFAALSLAVVLLVVSATSLYIERKRLFALADGAAIVGAEAFELDDVTVTDDGPRIVLHSDAISTAVHQYVADNALGSLNDLAIDRAATDDGASATVELSAYWRPPVLSLLAPEGLRIEVSSVARSVVLLGDAQP
jgi:uncharacterized membrane protein